MLIPLVFCSGLIPVIASDSFFPFIVDYLSEEFFKTPVYHAVDCSGLNEVKWLRSVEFRLMSVHRDEEPLEDWVDVFETQTFFLNVACPEAPSILRQGDALNLFRLPFRWLLLDPEVFAYVPGNEDAGSGSEWYWELLRELDILLSSEVRVTARGENGAVHIKGAYKTWKGDNMTTEDLAEWSPWGGLRLHSRESTAVRRWNVRGAPLIGSFVITQNDTLNHLDDIVDKHIDPTSKVGYVMHKHLAEMINASFKFVIRNTWGAKVNNSWTGMSGDLELGVAEVGVTPAFVLEERMSIMSYYELITPTKAKFIFLSPPLSFSSNIFTMPFDRMVWLCSLIMALVSCLFLFMTIRVEENQENEEEPRFASRRQSIQPRQEGISFGDIVMLNFGAICVQGTVVEFKGPSSRIIALFLYFSYMFLYVSYSGSIVALLQSSDTSITTFQSLLDSPLKVGADDVVYSQYYFKTATDPVRRALYERKIAPPGKTPQFLPAEKGIANVRKGLYAYHVETSVGYSVIQKTFTEEEKCGLQEFQISFFQNLDPYVAMNKDTPYREHMRIGMKRLVERGLNHRAVHRINTKKPICKAKGSRFVSVGITDCYPAFMTLIYGTTVALCTLVIEKLTRMRLMCLNREKTC